MNKKRLLIALGLVGALLLGGCRSADRVGRLKSEARSVDLQGAEPVRVEINFGAGDLKLEGGAGKLMEADFTYNVARLKPEVSFANRTLVVRQPESDSFPVLQGITKFRNEWGLRLYNDVPMDLRVDVGAGMSDLKLAGLSLTSFDFSQGAGQSTVDLNDDWAQDLDVAIDAGAADLTVRLPGNVGVRVDVDRGATMLDAPDLSQDGNTYTNDAYGVSEVTLRVNITGGIGFIHLELADSQ